MATRVPMIDLKAQYEALRDELDAAVARVAESQFFAQGPEVEALEAEIAEYSGARYAVGCASGSEALLLVFAALGIGPGDEVVVPSFTFFATAGSVSRLGATPVFADVDPATYNVTPETLERALRGRSRVRALVPVHLYGQAADRAGIAALGAAHGIPVIEDAAQAIGADDAEGCRVGSGEAPTCLSFFPTKNLGAWGEGGMVLTPDEALARRMRELRVHGSPQRYVHTAVGWNSRLDAIQAAVLRAKLPHLEGWHAARRAHAAAYDAAFHAAGALPSDVPLADGGLALRTPCPPKSPARHIYNQYVVRVPADRRDAVRAALDERGISTDVYYPIPLHLQECYAGLGAGPGDLPHAEAAAREVLALPVHPELAAADRERVAAALVETLEAGD